jgi:hypothetical protein
MFKFVCLLLVLVLIESRDFPQYNQCDAKWKDEKLGTSTNTICQVGALVSAASIGLSGLGLNQNPSTLNTWLKNNKGYVNKDDFVWASINSFGVVFEGKIPNTLLKLNLDVGYLVIINVNKGQHWVLATGYSGNTLNVVDSLYLNVKTYDISAVVSGNSGVYKVPTTFTLPLMINDLENKYLRTEGQERK